MIRLGVNIDHVATLRQARRGRLPDPVAAAVLATLGGADGITIHLREDRRHIQDRDVRVLRDTVTTRLNLEMSVAPEIVAIALATKPEECTLVPERRQELTTEGGLDVVAQRKPVEEAMRHLASANIPVSLFIDPDQKQIDMAKQLGAAAVELQTARYSEAKPGAEREHELAALCAAAEHARACDLHVHLGHGLDYENVMAVCEIRGVEELNIGHSIVARAVLVGMERAVRDMKDAIARGLESRGADPRD